MIGSSNMDLRSFTLNLEVLLVCYDKGVVAAMQPIFAELSGAREATQSGGMGRRARRWPKLAENISRLTAALQ